MAEETLGSIALVQAYHRQDQEQQRFQAENLGRYRAELAATRISASFTHPHLIRAYETVAGPEPYVVLETLTGETLARLLERRRRRLAATDLALLGVQLCSAVHYLHGRGLLHLDLKPANVVIDCRRVKLLDLSIACPPGPGRPGIGTAGYLAPEQARGGPLTTATDVWGIGITLYEAATGDPPFAGVGDPEDAPDCRDACLDEQAPPVGSRRRLPPGLAEAIDACLHPDPDARPAVRALAGMLDACLPEGRRAVRPPE